MKIREMMAAAAAAMACFSLACTAQEDPRMSLRQEGLSAQEDTRDLSHERNALCGPDEYVGIAAGIYRSAGGEAADMVLRYYDSAGSLVGEAIGDVDYFSGEYCFLPKGRLMRSFDENGPVILRTEDFGEVCHFRREGGRGESFVAGRDHVAAIKRLPDRLVIYNRDGSIAAEPALPAGCLPLLSSGSIQMIEAAGYLYVRVTADGERILTALIDEDGTVTEEGAPGFPGILGKDVYGSIGKYLILREKTVLPGPSGKESSGEGAPENTQETRTVYRIVSRDGKVMCEDAVLCWKHEYGLNLTDAWNRAQYAMIHEGETWRILDENLEEYGRIRDKDYQDNAGTVFADGSMTGLPCEELGWAVCGTSLSYLREKVPACRVEGGYLIPQDLGGFLPDPEGGGSIGGFSRQFILVNTDEGNRVVRRSDGKVICERDNFIYLQDETFIVWPDFSSDEHKSVICDENGEILYESDTLIFPCGKNYYIKRGPWAGIADANGNFLIRELQYDE